MLLESRPTIAPESLLLERLSSTRTESFPREVGMVPTAYNTRVAKCASFGGLPRMPNYYFGTRRRRYYLTLAGYARRRMIGESINLGRSHFS